MGVCKAPADLNVIRAKCCSFHRNIQFAEALEIGAKLPQPFALIVGDFVCQLRFVTRRLRFIQNENVELALVHRIPDSIR